MASPLPIALVQTAAVPAGDLGLWLVPGSVYERGADGRVYNTMPVYSPDGSRVASYRKVFPWRPYETCAPGSEFVVVDLGDHGRVGLSICYDAWFPRSRVTWRGWGPTSSSTSCRRPRSTVSRRWCSRAPTPS